MTLKRFALTAIACFSIFGWATDQTSAQVPTYRGSLSTLSPMSARRPGCFENVHRVYLRANQSYVIELQSEEFNAFLYLEDSHRRVLRSDDDSGGDRNAMILFRPGTSGWYHLAVTSCGRGESGRYTLTVDDVEATGE
jgi:hypothetical protein